jgi:hypothetical protein
MVGKLGVHPQQPENAALERELRCLYGTRAEIFAHWSRQAPPNHTGRMPSYHEVASRIPTGPGTDSPPARNGLPGQAGPTARVVARDRDHGGDGHVGRTPCRRQPGAVAL